jgi:5-(aminomethyl)-3-furanmethanol phosphate kinase
LWVVKLGGSLYSSTRLRAWMKALAAARGRVVIVPGGGPFADAVRAAQRRHRFADGPAHRMALLAMEQYGYVLAAMNHYAVPAASHAAIRVALAKGKVPVWMPSRMVEGRREIPESWRVTSDSLSAWLARRLGAERLLLVKSARLGEAAASAADLSRQGVVDPCFPAMCRNWKGRAFIAYAGQHRQFAAMLRAGGPPAVEIQSGRTSRTVSVRLLRTIGGEKPHPSTGSG